MKFWSNLIHFLKGYFSQNAEDEPLDFQISQHPFLKKLKQFWLVWMSPFLPTPVGEKKIRRLHRALNKDASWNLNYIMFTVSACLIATFGLISNSTAVIIGAMLVAPLMLPLRALAFSALEGDFALFIKALSSILGATFTALFLSWLVGNIVNIPEFGSEVLSRTQPNLVDLGIAITAGGISGFAKVRKGVSDVLAGTAIAVALMPPLCVVGLSFSQENIPYSTGALLLYLTNLLGITLACMIIFILAGYTEANHALAWTLSLTFVLFLPLGLSFWELVQQSQIKQTIKNTLLNQTVTLGQRDIELQDMTINWRTEVPLIILNVQTQEEISPKQVRLVQDFVSQSMKREFDILFIVDRIEFVEPAILDPETGEPLIEESETIEPEPEASTLETPAPEASQPETSESEESQPEEFQPQNPRQPQPPPVYLNKPSK